jgi:hypothetical protein
MMQVALQLISEVGDAERCQVLSSAPHRPLASLLPEVACSVHVPKGKMYHQPVKQQALFMKLWLTMQL